MVMCAEDVHDSTWFKAKEIVRDPPFLGNLPMPAGPQKGSEDRGNAEPQLDNDREEPGELFAPDGGASVVLGSLPRHGSHGSGGTPVNGVSEQLSGRPRFDASGGDLPCLVGDAATVPLGLVVPNSLVERQIKDMIEPIWRRTTKRQQEVWIPVRGTGVRRYPPSTRQSVLVLREDRGGEQSELLPPHDVPKGEDARCDVRHDGWVLARPDYDREQRTEAVSIGSDVGPGDGVEESLPFRTEHVVALDDDDESAVVRYVLQQVVQTLDALRRSGGGEFSERIGLRAPEQAGRERQRLAAFTRLVAEGLEKPTEPTLSCGARRNADRNQRSFPESFEHL